MFRRAKVLRYSTKARSRYRKIDGSSKPHTITSANGKTYSYDACGNMTNRNGQALIYDEENQLKQVTGTNTVTFGYADGGQRLWRQGATLDVFIGGLYELRGGKVLCHVFARGRRVCTFEPAGQVCTWLDLHPNLARAYYFCSAAGEWPFQEGRAPFAVTLIPLLGVLCVSVLSRRTRLFRFRFDTRIRVNPCHPWMQSVSVVLIVAVFVTLTPSAEAVTYTPVFYYYHPDHLGSANILTDRQGNLVQHYENTAFGKQRYQDNTLAFNVSNRYTGQVLDEDTGLYYYNARYYDPELGRFIQADAITPNLYNPQHLNRYSYVYDNPVNLIDPSGHSGWEWQGGRWVLVITATPIGDGETSANFGVAGGHVVKVSADVGLGGGYGVKDTFTSPGTRTVQGIEGVTDVILGVLAFSSLALLPEEAPMYPLIATLALSSGSWETGKGIVELAGVSANVEVKLPLSIPGAVGDLLGASQDTVRAIDAFVMINNFAFGVVGQPEGAENAVNVVHVATSLYNVKNPGDNQ